MPLGRRRASRGRKRGFGRGLRDRLQGFLARSRLIVILGSGSLACVLALVGLWIEPSSWGVVAFVALLATLWALVLAIAIYVVTSRETQTTLNQIEDLTEQIAKLAPRKPPAGQPNLIKSLSDFHDYVQAFRAEFPIPQEDITNVERPGKGKGNRPVIIDTLAGRRYSVYRGGRGKSGYTVTALPNDE